MSDLFDCDCGSCELCHVNLYVEEHTGYFVNDIKKMAEELEIYKERYGPLE